MDTEKKGRLLYTRQEAAYQLSICTRTLDTLILTKELKHIRIGRSVRVSGEELQRFIRRSHQTGKVIWEDGQRR